MNKNKNILISICSVMSLYWFLFFVYNIEKYTFIPAFEAVATLVAITFFGTYLIKKQFKNHSMLVQIYSFILISIGMIDGIIDMSLGNISDFTSIVLASSLVCEFMYVLIGVCLYWENKK